METIYLSLGSNRGDREGLLSAAAATIRDRVGGRIKLSSLYESEPWGFEDEASFYNIAARLRTALSPRKVLKEIRRIEEELGRQPRIAKPVSRTRDRRRIYEGRAIDIDILFYGSNVIFEKDLIIPHPRLAERRFVLLPMAEIAPDLLHPVLKKSIRELLASCPDTSRIRRIRCRIRCSLYYSASQINTKNSGIASQE